jgi:hypothetical protein
MNKHLTPEAADMLRRAKNFALFCGRTEIVPEDLLAAYMLTENPHRILDERMTREDVIARILQYIPLVTSSEDVAFTPALESLDSQSYEILQIADRVATENGRHIEIRDVMVAMLVHHGSIVVPIIHLITKATPDELLKRLRSQPV